VDFDYAKKFLNNIKKISESMFYKTIKALLSFKSEQISIENLIEKFEGIFKNYPELLEESFLFLDYKKVIIII
jgi:histone deacetylase complex regulatory component SIN3